MNYIKNHNFTLKKREGFSKNKKHFLAMKKKKLNKNLKKKKKIIKNI